MRGKHVHAILGFACGWISSTLFVAFTGPQDTPIEPAFSPPVHSEHHGGVHHSNRRRALEGADDSGEVKLDAINDVPAGPITNPYPPTMTYMPPGQSGPHPKGGRKVLIEIGARDGDSLWSLIRPYNKEKLLTTPKEAWRTMAVRDERNFDVMYIIEADPEFNPYWEGVLKTGRYFNNTPMPETYFYNKAVWVEDSHIDFELRGTGSRIIQEKDRAAAKRVDPGHGKLGSGMGITVLESSLGMNCNLPGYDTTKDLAKACDGKQTCRYRIDMWKLGGDIDGCHWHKIFKARYTCDDDNFRQEVTLESKVEGDTKNIQLTCAGAQDGSSKGCHLPQGVDRSLLPAPAGLTEMRIEAMNFDKFLRYNIAPTDHVTMKIDIEGAEIPLMNRLIQTKGVQLIDEMFYECHYHELTWQNPDVSTADCRKQCEEMVQQGVNFWFWARREINPEKRVDDLKTHETDAWWIKCARSAWKSGREKAALTALRSLCLTQVRHPRQ